MKPVHIVLAVLSGAIAGATVGLLFAPDKGSNTREKIKGFMKKKGIHLKKDKMEELAAEIESELEKK